MKRDDSPPLTIVAALGNAMRGHRSESSEE
jgi:hypothetical protein